MKSYEEATRIIIVLSYATSFRYYQNKKKSLSKFLLSWIYNVISFFTCVYFIFYLEICNLNTMPYNKERITYTFLLFIFLYGYITITITGWYKSKVMDLQRSFRIFIFLWFFVPVSFSSSYILVLVQDMIALRNRIDQVDENLKEIGIEIEYRSVYRKVKITGLVWLIHWIILVGLFLNLILKYRKRISEIIINVSYAYIINVESLLLYDYDIFIQYVYRITIYQFWSNFSNWYSKIAVG